MRIQCIATSSLKALKIYYHFFYEDHYSDMEAFKVLNGELRYYLCYPESFHFEFTQLLNQENCEYFQNACLDVSDEVYIMKSKEIEKELGENN
jgi:hypothetical protein